MARKKKAVEPLPTIWRVDDVLWAEVESVLAEYDPPAKFGPKRIDQRKALDGVIYRMRSGVQWNQLPAEFGDDSSVHRTSFQPRYCPPLAPASRRIIGWTRMRSGLPPRSAAASCIGWSGSLKSLA